MKVKIYRGAVGDSALAETLTVKAGTSIVFLVSSVITGELYARFYEADDTVHQIPATQILSIDPDETSTPLPVRYRDPETGAVIGRNDAAAAEDAARAEPPPVDRSALCTTNGQTPDEVRANQTNETGQHAGYIVLCDAERAKGFVRPYRDRYKHTSCGGVTTMGRALSETYARDPKFYSATFCCTCNRHLPVDEFVWSADGERVGS